jgi:hypothetical protein
MEQLDYMRDRTGLSRLVSSAVLVFDQKYKPFTFNALDHEVSWAITMDLLNRDNVALLDSESA